MIALKFKNVTDSDLGSACGHLAAECRRAAERLPMAGPEAKKG